MGLTGKARFIQKILAHTQEGAGEEEGGQGEDSPRCVRQEDLGRCCAIRPCDRSLSSRPTNRYLVNTVDAQSPQA